MSLGFWELPGPSTFAAEIERLVQGGESAAVVLPPGTPAGLGSLLGARARAEGRYWYSLLPGDAQPVAALADLIPGLHRETRRDGEWFWQFALMMAGVAVIAVSTAVLHAH